MTYISDILSIEYVNIADNYLCMFKID
ncbi:uncharacterized protein METZ01_LOCUS107583 [marine metagenome]|uniref:Uncharacterized protein n=1 Tax=marine metagenome TaxID=408172 RepID=A0A381WQE3_9ZZZZ